MSFPPASPIPAQLASSGEPPLWAPYYGASIGVAFSRFWRKCATFSGRASRSEFWWWYLVYIIFVIILNIVSSADAAANPTSGAVNFSPAHFVVLGVSGIVSLGVLVPTLAIMWRRLHDTNRSGRYYFLALIPLVGAIILIVFLASASNPAGARFDLPRT